jgi:hypothetical protein
MKFIYIRRFIMDRNIINICWDEVFKIVFAGDSTRSRRAAQGLLSAYLEQDLTILRVDIAELPPSIKGQRQIRYDLLVEFVDGRLANLEMTLFPEKAEVLRQEYYLARLFSSQKIKSPQTYKDLKETYQLSFFVNKNQYDDEAWEHRFIYYDPERHIPLGGRTQIITVELKKIEKIAGKPVSEMNSKERWACYFRYFADEGKKDLLEAIYRHEENIAMAEQVVSLLDEERLAYIRETKANADMMSYWSAIEEAQEREAELAEKKQQLKDQDLQLKNQDLQLKDQDLQLKDQDLRIKELNLQNKNLEMQVQEMRQMLNDAGLLKDKGV